MFNKSNTMIVMVMLFMVVLLAAGAFATAETPAKPDNPQAKTAGGDIPTLSEWGMIIFSVLLVGWISFVLVRRRRLADVQI